MTSAGQLPCKECGRNVVLEGDELSRHIIGHVWLMDRDICDGNTGPCAVCGYSPRNGKDKFAHVLLEHRDSLADFSQLTPRLGQLSYNLFGPDHLMTVMDTLRSGRNNNNNHNLDQTASRMRTSVKSELRDGDAGRFVMEKTIQSDMGNAEQEMAIGVNRQQTRPLRDLPDMTVGELRHLNLGNLMTSMINGSPTTEADMIRADQTLGQLAQTLGMAALVPTLLNTLAQQGGGTEQQQQQQQHFGQQQQFEQHQQQQHFDHQQQQQSLRHHHHQQHQQQLANSALPPMRHKHPSATAAPYVSSMKVSSQKLRFPTTPDLEPGYSRLGAPTSTAGEERKLPPPLRKCASDVQQPQQQQQQCSKVVNNNISKNSNTGMMIFPGTGSICKNGKVRKRRTSFNTDQLSALEEAFGFNQYPGLATREQLAKSLNITNRCVKFWFKNRRSKARNPSGASALERFRLDTLQQSPKVEPDSTEQVSPTSSAGSNEDNNAHSGIDLLREVTSDAVSPALSGIAVDDQHAETALAAVQSLTECGDLQAQSMSSSSSPPPLPPYSEPSLRHVIKEWSHQDEEETATSTPTPSASGGIVVESGDDQQQQQQQQVTPSFGKTRRPRTVYWGQQLLELERAFQFDWYPSLADRERLATFLGLPCSRISVWFKNRRAKQKWEELQARVCSGGGGVAQDSQNIPGIPKYQVSQKTLSQVLDVKCEDNYMDTNVGLGTTVADSIGVPL